MVILSQRDPNWRNTRLGYGSTTIGSFGCTIVALNQLLLLNNHNFTPPQVNDRLKQHNGFVGTNRNLLVWSAIEKAFPGIAKFEWRGYTYDNDRVLDSIKKYGGCMVEVDGAPIGAPRHWVLYIGNRRALDPWTGTEIATSKYKATGYAIVQVTKGGSMSGDLMQIKKSDFEKLMTNSLAYDEYQKIFQSPAQAKQLLDNLKTDLKREKDRVKEANERAEGYKKEQATKIAELASMLELRQEYVEIKTTIESMIKQIDELEDYKKDHQDDSRQWAESELSLRQEIARLQALLKQEDVLQNADLADLIRELIRRMKQVLLHGEK